MQRSTLILLFLSVSFSVIIIVAGIFIFIKTPASKQQKADILNITKDESSQYKKEEDIWLKELASIKNPKKSYSYPVQEIYINLNSKE